ncbi:MAG: hypothetical protein LBU40_04485 [Methanobrevibacter sp.]|jgi:cell shape-determining protein MreC|nr:hypothetical protein [Methanobrevibacter sp.]
MEWFKLTKAKEKKTVQAEPVTEEQVTEVVKNVIGTVLEDVQNVFDDFNTRLTSMESSISKLEDEMTSTEEIKESTEEVDETTTEEETKTEETTEEEKLQKLEQSIVNKVISNLKQSNTGTKKEDKFVETDFVTDKFGRTAIKKDSVMKFL